MKKSIRIYITELLQQYYDDYILSPQGGGHQHLGNNSNCKQLIQNYIGNGSFRSLLFEKVKDLIFSFNSDTYQIDNIGIGYYDNVKISRIRSVYTCGVNISNNIVSLKNDNPSLGEFASIKIDISSINDDLLNANLNIYWDSILLESLLSENEYNLDLISTKIKQLETEKKEKENELKNIATQIQSFEWIASFMTENKIDVMDQTLLKTKMALNMLNIEDDAEKETNIFELFQLTI